MVRHGVAPHDALRSATVQGARTLGLSAHLGTVQPGRIADLALVEGDPTTDIAATAAVREVVVGGVPHTVDDLIAAASRTESATAVRNRALPEVPQQAARDRYRWHREELAPHSCC
jgi:adenine deaminase